YIKGKDSQHPALAPGPPPLAPPHKGRAIAYGNFLPLGGCGGWNFYFVRPKNTGRRLPDTQENVRPNSICDSPAHKGEGDERTRLPFRSWRGKQAHTGSPPPCGEGLGVGVPRASAEYQPPHTST